MTAVFPPFRSSLSFVLLLALLVRLLAAVALEPPLISDDKDYVAAAHAMLRGEGFSPDGVPTAYRLPGYPALLAAIFAVAGPGFLAVRVLQAVLDTLSCLLVFRLGRALSSDRTGIVAASAYALFPLQILYVSAVMTETAFTFLLLLVIDRLLSNDDRRVQDILTGILTGIAILFRSTALIVPLILLLPGVGGSARLERRAMRFALVVGAALVVLLPWTIRNGVTFGRWNLTSNTGVNFWIGNHPGASGSYSWSPDSPLEKIPDEFERSDAGIRLGLEFWRERPAEAGVTVVKKLAHFFEIDYWMLMLQNYDPDWRSYPRAVLVYRELPTWQMAATQLPFIVATLLAVLFWTLAPPTALSRWLPLLLLCGSWVGIHLVFYAGARYRFPIHPLLLMAAAEGALSLAAGRLTITPRRAFVLALLSLILLAGWAAELWILSTASPLART